MFKTKILMLLVLVVIIIPIVICGCESNQDTIDTNKDVINTNTPREIEYSPEHSIDSYAVLLDDSLVYFSFSNYTTVTFYRYYWDGRLKEIGHIQDYVFNLGFYTMVNNDLYFYITKAESQEAVFENNEYDNVIYCINLTNNDLHEVYSESYCLPGAIIGSIGDYLVSRQSHRSEDNQLSTYIELLNLKTSEIEKKTTVYVLDDNTNVGTYMINMCTDGKNIYALVDQRFQDGTNRALIHKYNEQLELVSEIEIDAVAEYILSARVGKMAVFQDCIYMENYSGDAVIGRIKDDKVENLISDKGINFAIQYEYENVPLFFMRGSNVIYKYNEEQKKVETIKLDLKDGYLLKNIMIKNDDVLVILFKYSSSPNDVPKDRLIWLKKDSISSIQ